MEEQYTVEIPSSCRPISLLNLDMKILSGGLAKTITLHAVSDTPGSSPSAALTITCDGWHVWHSTPIENEDCALELLDIEQTFDSVDWSFMWATLRVMRMGEGFIKWLQLLYTAPQARLRMGGLIS